ncbi:AIPR family protein [Kitasatospora sp. NPDC059817]|uniref:AIPR family protein n=1 Tax=Kitasatospora sp. NPDC059817 TaxID=3346961 RepID=UPI00364C5B77
MEDQNEALQDVPLEVRQVRHALTQEFASLLDLSDLQTLDPDQREQIFLSRALAAKAGMLVADCTAAEAAASVTDGADEHGIDAVLVSPATAELWLVQSKWSNRATARLDSTAVQKLIQGLERLVNRQFDRFNARFHRLVDQVNGVINEEAGRIHIVLAAMGDEGLSRDGQDILSETAADYNRFGQMLDFRVLSVADFHSAARQASRPTPVSVTATLSDGWHMSSTPYQTYVGTVAAGEPAEWYGQYGERLFDQNVRFPLGLTNVNVAMIDSLIDSPHDFWYFNNGITVLCDSVRAKWLVTRRAPSQPVRLELVNARVVNGAQTVASLYHVYKRDPDAVAEALISLRVICLDGAPADLAQRITRATNTQNSVEARDFAALDPQQELIRDDFFLSLGKSYVLKRGEPDPAPAAGCSVVEAALALACSYPDASVVARVRQDSDFLWRRESGGLYTQLFGNRPSALQIWRSVKLMRRVRDALAALAESLEGRNRVVADQADLLIIHIAFQLIGVDGIDDAGDDWEARLERTVEMTGATFTALLRQLDASYGRYAFLNRTFRNEQSCQHLVTGVLHSLEQGVDPQPPIPRRLNRRRRPNTVPLLVEFGRIKDGTQLVYRPNGEAELEALRGWMSEAPERYLASWVNDDRRPLIWAVDGQRYSPSALVLRIWEEAQWVNQPVAVQGVRSWYLPGEGTLVDLADQLLAETDTGDGPGVE